MRCDRLLILFTVFALPLFANPSLTGRRISADCLDAYEKMAEVSDLRIVDFGNEKFAGKPVSAAEVPQMYPPNTDGALFTIRDSIKTAEGVTLYFVDISASVFNVTDPGYGCLPTVLPKYPDYFKKRGIRLSGPANAKNAQTIARVVITDTASQNRMLDALDNTPGAAPFRFKDWPKEQDQLIPEKAYRQGFSGGLIWRASKDFYFAHDRLAEHEVGALALTKADFAPFKARADFIGKLESVAARSEGKAKEVLLGIIERFDKGISEDWDKSTQYIAAGLRQGSQQQIVSGLRLLSNFYMPDVFLFREHPALSSPRDVGKAVVAILKREAPESESLHPEILMLAEALPESYATEDTLTGSARRLVERLR